MDLLARETQINNLDADVKMHVLALINATICAGSGRESVQFRHHMRYEFVLLGIEEIIPRLKRYVGGEARALVPLLHQSLTRRQRPGTTTRSCSAT